MSFRAMIIPEDHTNDEHILILLLSRILQECGRPRAKLKVLQNPRAQGYEYICQKIRDSEVFTKHKNFNDLFVFIPDNDGKDRTAQLEALEEIATEHDVRLIACAAVEEVETWLLAGHTDQLGATSWSEVRGDPSVKENHFEAFLAKHGDPKSAGGGREELMQATLQNYPGLKQRCPEIAELERRICEAVAS